MALRTIPEAAERLRLSRRTIEKLVAERRIRIRKFGRAVRIADADLDAYDAAHTVEPAGTRRRGTERA